MSFRKIHTCCRLFYQKPNNIKNKKLSSQNWLIRQLKDPYVEKAKKANYRCRSAYKLIEIQSRYNILEPGQVVIDCGAAPGSWTQVATKYTNSLGGNLDEPIGTVISIDKQPFQAIPGARLLCNLDFTKKLSQQRLLGELDGKLADVVMSDMAPHATGVKEMDHENIIKLGYSVFKFALEVSAFEAHLIIKLWDGGMAKQLENDIRRFYQHLKIVRPDATRDESAEKFIVARGFRGVAAQSSCN